MARETEVQELLDKWKEEYNLPNPVRFMGYMNLGKGVMGRCKSWKDRSEVEMAPCWKDEPLGWMMKSVLWHEMCHTIAYQEDMVGNGHDSRWRELRNSRKSYMIGDFFAKLIYAPKTW